VAREDDELVANAVFQSRDPRTAISVADNLARTARGSILILDADGQVSLAAPSMTTTPADISLV